MPFDPLTREPVGHADHESVVRELGAAGACEPRAIRRGVERPLEPTGDFRPQTLRSQLELTLHAPVLPLSLFPARRRAASITACFRREQAAGLQAFLYVHTTLHRCGNDVVTRVLRC